MLVSYLKIGTVNFQTPSEQEVAELKAKQIHIHISLFSNLQRGKKNQVWNKTLFIHLILGALLQREFFSKKLDPTEKQK